MVTADEPGYTVDTVTGVLVELLCHENVCKSYIGALTDFTCNMTV